MREMGEYLVSSIYDELFNVYRYNSLTGKITVPSGGHRFYYFSVYCLQI